MAKITEEQLKKVNEGQEKLISLVNQIGVLESQKHGLLHQVADVNKEYGPVNIDLKTGEYEIIETETELEKA